MDLSLDLISRYDAHWRPYSLFCSVCLLPYNHIIHFENLNQEEKWIIKKMSASEVIQSR